MDPVMWLASATPVVVLFALVASGKVGSRTAALVVAALTAVLALGVFGASPRLLAVAVAKGAWLGAWILGVVLPAMLLYRLAERAGLQDVGELFSRLFPRRSENLLVLAWVLPTFVQGVAGFGTPIAVAAPLLVASGWRKERAIAYPLIGYHWSVTFGSMGSSYYMAALTAHLDPASRVTFAHDAAIPLGVNCLVAGALVLLMDRGWRGLRSGVPLLLGAGLPMAATLYWVTGVVPAVGSVAAGAVGFVCAFALARLRRARHATTSEPAAVAVGAWAGGPGQSGGTGRPASPGAPAASGDEVADAHAPDRPVGWLVAPYVYLVVTAMAVLVPPASRAWAQSFAVIAPSFPATSTSLGFTTPAAAGYTPVEPLAHPGTYLVLACLLGYATYRIAGLWHRRPARELANAWFSSVKGSIVSIMALACVTTIMIHAGMVDRLARGVAGATGAAYPALAGFVGGLGSFLTGSTTSSNALFSSLQVGVSGLLDVPATLLLAAQTAGANVGNSLAPMVLLIGIGAVGGGVSASRLLRLVLPPALVLLAVVSAITALRTGVVS